MFNWKIDDDISLTLPQYHMAAELTELVQANLDRLKPWMVWAVDDYSVETANDYIKRTLKSFVENGRFEACILWKQNVIGTIGYHNFDEVNHSAYIGYWIAKGYEGKGIVTKCCSALLDHLFIDRNINRVAITCNVDNTRSRAVPERLGFTHEGTRRQAECHNGRFRDWAVYSMLKDEWVNSRDNQE